MANRVEGAFSIPWSSQSKQSSSLGITVPTTAQWLALAGIGFLLTGLFLPIFALPTGGTITIWELPVMYGVPWHAVMVIGLAATACCLIAKRRLGFLAIPGILIYFTLTWARIDAGRVFDLATDPRILGYGVSFAYGWLVQVVGSVLLMVSAAVAWCFRQAGWPVRSSPTEFTVPDSWGRSYFSMLQSGSHLQN